MHLLLGHMCRRHRWHRLLRCPFKKTPSTPFKWTWPNNYYCGDDAGSHYGGGRCAAATRWEGYLCGLSYTSYGSSRRSSGRNGSRRLSGHCHCGKCRAIYCRSGSCRSSHCLCGSSGTSLSGSSCHCLCSSSGNLRIPNTCWFVALLPRVGVPDRADNRLAQRWCKNVWAQVPDGVICMYNGHDDRALRTFSEND